MSKVSLPVLKLVLVNILFISSIQVLALAPLNAKKGGEWDYVDTPGLTSVWKNTKHSTVYFSVTLVPGTKQFQHSKFEFKQYIENLKTVKGPLNDIVGITDFKIYNSEQLRTEKSFTEVAFSGSYQGNNKLRRNIIEIHQFAKTASRFFQLKYDATKIKLTTADLIKLVSEYK